jgi:hypothetical protein
VLEHVPDIDAALRETARVLKRGGAFIGTFPFFFERQDGVRFASLINGALVHHLEPIYHGNPFDPNGGSLVFEISGWDIINRAHAAGFSRATMRFVCNQEKGIVATSLAEPLPAKGIFVAVFEK